MIRKVSKIVYPRYSANSLVISDVDGLQTALDAKQNNLVFDNNPEAGSDNPVTSEGIKNYVDSTVEAHNPVGNKLYLFNNHI